MGYIDDPSIQSVQVTYDYQGDTKTVDAKMKSKKDHSFYFTFVENPKEKMTYKVHKYAKEGQLVETEEVEGKMYSN